MRNQKTEQEVQVVFILDVISPSSPFLMILFNWLKVTAVNEWILVLEITLRALKLPLRKRTCWKTSEGVAANCSITSFRFKVSKNLNCGIEKSIHINSLCSQPDKQTQFISKLLDQLWRKDCLLMENASLWGTTYRYLIDYFVRNNYSLKYR